MSFLGFGTAATKEECKTLETASKNAKDAFDKCQNAPTPTPTNGSANASANTSANGSANTSANGSSNTSVNVQAKPSRFGLGFWGLGGKRSKSQKNKDKKRGGKKSRSQKNKDKKRGGKKSKSQKKH